MLVRSLQKQLFAQKISTKLAIFYRLFFGEVRPKIFLQKSFEIDLFFCEHDNKNEI